MAQTPFLLLNPRAGWSIVSQSAGLDVAGQIQLQPLPGDSRPLADPSGDLGGLALPSALAVGRDGRLFVLDGDRLARFDECAGRWATLPGIGGSGAAPRRFNAPQGMTITCRNELVVADTGNRRVQIFQMKGLPLSRILGPFRVGNADGQWAVTGVKPLPRDLCSPADAPPQFPAGTWQPVDVAGSPHGRLYVADAANNLIHVFDRRGCWRGAWDGRDEAGIGLSQPTHLALDKLGNLVVVQAGAPEVVVLNPAGEFVRRVSLPAEVAANFRAAGIGFDRAGRLHLTDPQSGCVLVFDDSQARASTCRPLGHRCRPTALVFDGSGGAALVDKLSGIVYQLQEQTSYAASGAVILGPLDSEQYRCIWHRVELAVSLPPGTLVKLDTFTADARRLAAQLETLPENRWETGQIDSSAGLNRWDCLITGQPGRYLWLRLSLFGDQLHTPAIDSIRVEYPRQSSLRYLPAVFREEPDSAEFLDRFLSLLDHFWEQIGATIDRMPQLLNPAGAPAEFLPWLASWLGLALDPTWPEATQRRLIKNAYRLFPLRGTAAGLKLYVALITGREPHILEYFKLRRWLFLNRGRLGSQTVLWGAEVVDRLQLDVHSEVGNFQLTDGGDPLLDPLATYAHRFAVYVILPHADDRQQQMVQQLVEESKPAHAQAEVIFVQPGLCLGRELFVGVNMVIGDYPAGVTTDASRLGEGSVLSPSAEEIGPPRLRLDHKVRLGVNARLDG
ncbi:MAG: hypothetical protein FOGNACKC_00022 [Anaerolineae bacterium]|nr:hypothetical protein [Anaerolineae bacterium]